MQEYSILCKNVPFCVRMFHSVQEYFILRKNIQWKNIPFCARIFHSMQEYSILGKNIPNCARRLLYVKKHSIMSKTNSIYAKIFHLLNGSKKVYHDEKSYFILLKFPFTKWKYFHSTEISIYARIFNSM